MKSTVAAALLSALVLWPAGAGAGTVEEDFRKALSAYNTGDFAVAQAIWQRLAEQGDARSQAGLGFLYHHGFGVAKDDEQAAHWLALAARQGQAEGQLMLGSLYFFGRGVEQSYVLAYAWCDLAQSNGQSDASLCRDAALQSMSHAEMKRAFRTVVELRELYFSH